ncbi:MAG: hypothetical protein AB1646_24245, partial [Thermodesulfobacteriota bacterium]
ESRLVETPVGEHFHAWLWPSEVMVVLQKAHGSRSQYSRPPSSFRMQTQGGASWFYATPKKALCALLELLS